MEDLKNRFAFKATKKIATTTNEKEVSKLIEAVLSEFIEGDIKGISLTKKISKVEETKYIITATLSKERTVEEDNLFEEDEDNEY